MSVQQPDIRSIRIAALVFSETPAQRERRAHFDQAKLKELAESIRSEGLLQPIVVRPIALREFNEERFEVVVGERRVRAHTIAGLKEILSTVRDLDDKQVAKIQLVENLQREDVHPIAEAEGYEELMQKHGYSADQVADEVGKSKAYVYARLKLLALLPEARKAFYSGKLNPSTALLLARVPGPDLQKKALAEITKPLHSWDEDKSPMSVRQAQKHLQDNYMLRLSDAGFKTSDPDLVPSAGPCGTCPKRTGNQPELFGDVKGADVCTDPTCFKQKIAAHAERALAAAKETGQKVLAGADALKVAKHGTENHNLQGYVRLDASDYHGNTARPKTYRQTLGKDYVATLLQDPETGKMIEVAPNKDVDKAHGNKDRASNDRSTERFHAQQRATERKHRMEIAYRGALFKAIHDAGAGRKSLTSRELEAAADRLFERLDHDSKKRLFAALGWDAKKSRHHGGIDLDLPTPVDKMTDEQLVQLIRDCSLAYELQVWQHSGETRPKLMEAAATALDVDAKKIRRELEAAAKAKDAKKAAPSKASKKKGRK